MNRFFFIGDLHGDVMPLIHLHRQKELTKDDWVILLGDSGLNYWINKSDRMADMKQQFANIPCNIFVIRGNHEERAETMEAMYPNQWEDLILDDEIFGLVRRELKYPNIFYALDMPWVYRINNYSALVIPGAYSVDKYYRLKRKYNWFDSEQLTEEEKVIGKNLALFSNHYDFILSHTCPIEYEPTDLFLPMIDQTTVDKSMELYLSEINQLTNSNFWLFGHYHANRVYPLRQGEGQKIMLFQKALEMDNILKGNYWEMI